MSERERTRERGRGLLEDKGLPATFQWDTHISLMSCFVTENCSFNSWETIPKFKLNLLHMDDIKKKKKIFEVSILKTQATEIH